MVDLNPNTVSNPINSEGLVTKPPGWVPVWVKNHWMPIHYDTLYPGESDKVEKIIIDCNPNDGIMFVNGPMMNQVLHMPNPTEHYMAAVPGDPTSANKPLSSYAYPTISTKKVVYNLKVDSFKIGHVIYNGKYYVCSIPHEAPEEYLSTYDGGPSSFGKSWYSDYEVNQLYEQSQELDPWEPDWDEKLMTSLKPVTMSFDVDYTETNKEAFDKIFGIYGTIKKQDPEEPALWEQI